MRYDTQVDAQYTIQSMPSDKAAYTPRGACKDLILCHDPEVIIAGPAETGKTMACCWKLHLVACKYPGAQLAIVRLTQKSLYATVLQTWERVITGAPVRPLGGTKPERYLYSNGSVVWVGGMDNADKVLSSERDMIYVNQAEELSLASWETLTTRTTGRNAVVRWPQLIGDANPGGSKHWIRARQGLTILRSIHKDNPTLYDENGNLTPQGERTIGRLSMLTGVRRKRLYEGIWATAEGAVYDMFDAAVHVRTRPADEMVLWHIAVDAGYTHPAVVLLIGEDGDGRWHIAKEFYRTQQLQDVVVNQVVDYAANRRIGIVAVDAAAAGLIAALKKANIPAKSAKGRVIDGIAKIQERLAIAGDGQPRLTVDPEAVNTINEFESYVWKPNRDEPVKENDHAMDAIRYLADAAKAPAVSVAY